jgi:hypothetical protein
LKKPTLSAGHEGQLHNFQRLIPFTTQSQPMDYNRSVYDDSFTWPDDVEEDPWSAVTLSNHSLPNDVILQGVTRRQRYDEVETLSLRHIGVALYCITFVCGFLGNTLTIVAIATSKHMKTVATCFMLNLAVADDLFMLSLPFMAHNTLTQDWPFGGFACKLLSALYGVNCYSSIFTMTVMSIDRYLAVVHPFTSLRYRRPRNALIVCVVIWAVCVLVMTPYWIYAGVNETPRNNGTRKCKIYWPAGQELLMRKFWIHFELVVGFVVPILVMVVCYLQLLYGIVYSSGKVNFI